MEKALSAEAVRMAQIARLKQLECGVVESLVPLPDETKLTKGLAVLVDYTVDTNWLCCSLGVVNHLDFVYHTNLRPQPEQRYQWIYGVTVKEMPSVPNDSIEGILSAEDLRGLTTAETLALYREKPELLNDHCLEAPSSRFHGDLPLLCLGGGHPRLFVKLCRRCPRTVAACLK